MMEREKVFGKYKVSELCWVLRFGENKSLEKKLHSHRDPISALTLKPIKPPNHQNFAVPISQTFI